jgi:tetratricopeptide (TPR) repeat protein
MRLRLLVAFAVLVFSASASAQTVPASPQAPTGTSERQRALELYDQNRLVEARPILEHLAAEQPDDQVVLERYGITLVACASSLTDGDERKALRIRARSVLLRAKELGDNSDLLRVMLEGLPEDGSQPPFSSRKEADDIMHIAEGAFAAGDMDKAREGYLQALVLDPSLYEAALFAGDTLFRQKRYEAAGQWFSTAIQIKADTETAYRYWGDALGAAGRMDEARAKYIDAVIAEPYSNRPRTALAQWAQRNRVQFRVLQLAPGSSLKIEDGKTTITIDPRTLKKDGPDDGSSAWMLYAITRAAWASGKFKQEYPNETAYRHSLKEELDALATVATAAGERRKEGAANEAGVELRPDLAELVRIHRAGFLEPYILLFRPDEGIVKDYGAYRAVNRDKLRRYLDEFVVPQVTATPR